MSDDPYDFEIALPTVPSNASRSTRDLSESDEDANGSLSNMSSIGSDDDSEQGAHGKRQNRTELNSVRTSRNANAGAASSSALDKAKTFLSKYSNVAMEKPSGSVPTTSRRISLELDDDDFSVEFSSGDDKKDYTNESTPRAILSSTVGNGGQDSISLQRSDWQNDDRKKDEIQQIPTDVYHNEDEDGESSQNNDQSHPISASLPALTACHDSVEGEVGDSIESFHSDTSEDHTEKAAKNTFNALPEPNYQDHYEASADDYLDSFHEESLEQSQISNIVDNPESHLSTPGVPSATAQQFVASESGAYEEEAFEEDSAAALSIPAISLKAAIPLNQRDYRGEDPSSAHDDSSSQPLEVHQIPTLRFESDVYQEKVFNENATAAAFVPGVSLSPTVKVTQNNSQGDDITSARDVSLNHSNGKKDSTSRIVPLVDSAYAPAFQSTNKTDEDNELISTKRSCVTIIRAFDEGRRVEMRDASTQFTGNHAAIQTDLVPEGMHNLLTSTPHVPPPSRENDDALSDRESTRVQGEPQPPPPPISSVFGSTMYSLDALKLPVTASTSIYKQQLLALQEQILQKKRETERIVHDRMAFQYSSLRGTERVRQGFSMYSKLFRTSCNLPRDVLLFPQQFIAARRTQKLELWEALMRVDPTLDEQKARKAARLAEAAST
ncbi:unnamed protein product [Phytophthora fragariaefolia]|uniref:Unnamed protein product n=1 Tax=Phytophthora fragariaefolia TaxID=1490495 RepID=A0A9W6XNF3_9STRA|nr:unnamed protein product [Phytophthora fragariaefolia]